MTLGDLIWAGAIILGAVYLIYRFLWKKQGYCPGCDAHSCGTRQQKNDKGEKCS